MKKAKILLLTGFAILFAASLTLASTTGGGGKSKTESAKIANQENDSDGASALENAPPPCAPNCVCKFVACAAYCNPAYICRPNQVDTGTLYCFFSPFPIPSNNCGEPAPCCPKQD